MDDLTQETKANPPNSHTEQEWQKKFFAMGAMCHYCQKPLMFKEATRDHRTPKCRGGSNRIWNIVPACLPCNQKKGWRTEAEFLKARPAFDKELSTNSQLRPAKEKLKPSTTLTKARFQPTGFLEERNEPGLLRRLVAERETKAGWWRSA